MAKYYAYISGDANVITDFNPYTFYTDNSKYMRLEYNGDIYNPPSGAFINSAVFFIYDSSLWFSLELYDSNRKQYMNFGTSTYIGSYNDWGTSGFETTTVFEYDNGTATVSKDDKVVTTTYSGSPGRGIMPFFPTTYATNLRMKFYRLAIYNKDKVQYEFVPYLMNGEKGILDRVSGKFYAATDQSKMELISLSSISVEPESISAPYAETTVDITLTVDEGVSWFESSVPSWVSLSADEGTGSTVITATIAKNTASTPRTGIIVFEASNGDTAEIQCTQDKHPLLVPVNNIYRGGLVID